MMRENGKKISTSKILARISSRRFTMCCAYGVAHMRSEEDDNDFTS